MQSSDSDSPRLFRRQTSLAELNALSGDTAIARLGIVFTDLGPDYLRGTMPVDARTHQPYGLLHGGASVLLAETLGSSAGNLCVGEDSLCVGIEINANHLRAVSKGIIKVEATPLYSGRTMSVWNIEIRDAREKLVCTSRCSILLRRGGAFPSDGSQPT